jgi:hypothetical protein
MPLNVDSKDSPDDRKDELSYKAVDFSQFSQDTPLFVKSSSSDSEFVFEVFFREKYNSDGSCSRIDVIPTNDPERKQELFKGYFSGKISSPLFRGEFEFILCFHNWIKSSDSFDKILSDLDEQSDIVRRLLKWQSQGKIKVLQVDDSPSMLYFTTTIDIFQEVFTHSAIIFDIIDDYTVTLVQNQK